MSISEYFCLVMAVFNVVSILTQTIQKIIFKTKTKNLIKLKFTLYTNIIPNCTNLVEGL